MTIHLAFQVNTQELPTPDDIICCSDKIDKLMAVLRNRAHDQNMFISTSGNPMFQYEFRRHDNTLHSFIAIKELPVL